jgi:hypothetical protein
MVGFYRVQLIVNDGVQNSAPVTFLTEVTADGRPTANVSLSENSGSVDRPIILNGTRSSDPEMQPLTYRWSVVVVPIGGTAIIANPTAAATTWTADTAGTYRMQLIVNDGINDSAPVTFAATVADDVPTANVSLSQNSGTVGVSVLLDGTRSSDPEMRPLTFAWSIVDKPVGSVVTIDDPFAAATTMTADTAGTYRVRLIVNNGLNDSDPVQFTVEIADPLIVNGPLSEVDEHATAGEESMLDRFFAMLGR